MAFYILLLWGSTIYKKSFNQSGMVAFWSSVTIEREQSQAEAELLVLNVVKRLASMHALNVEKPKGGLTIVQRLSVRCVLVIGSKDVLVRVAVD